MIQNSKVNVLQYNDALFLLAWQVKLEPGSSDSSPATCQSDAAE